uniref:Uncharacterized protein n=1 Tax=Cajanus cajan TaxID=3821 RepID=A0A151QSF3_CAJCA|nr:hypothetical protein KK1_045981 [Cajanus cajan]
MAQPTNLRVIGSEGFALIDKIYGPSSASARRRPNRNGVFPTRQGRWVVQVYVTSCTPKHDSIRVLGQRPLRGSLWWRLL